MLLKPTIVLAFLALAELIDAGGHAPKRPHHEPTPLQPYKAFPTSSPRRKTCFVKPGKKSGDDSSKILRAFKKCNNGGTVVLDQEYTICTQLDLRFLKHVDIALTGTDGSSWWLFGGEDINLYGAGTGTIDGNGQAWYDAHAADSKVKRPLLFVTDGWKGGSITGLKLRQSPNWHNLIANSSDILISDIDIFSRSTSNNFAKNLDGWDTYRSDNIVIQNSYIDHDDDCVSFKPNSTNIIVQGLVCNSSHGISVGSLGQYPGVFDNIENLYIYNISMSNATDGARLKVWPGADVQKPEGWIGGGGEGRVRNVTYERFFNDNNDGAIKIDQCYGAVSAAECEADPSKVILTDILFKDFWGTVSKKNDPVVGSLICSSEDSCDNIRAENVTVTPPSGKDAKWACRNMDEELLDLNGVGCVDA
ncbi:Exopolygalacturonase X-2 [Fusarium oligoseptatum]|uniref:galacturonan 1,4-alpha-galacturonidase n=1 Tax=Fusarium oligoseptatum TaxID=2604345 RepID=A0A428S8E1_9HYPO|nr:Exopolygalacturonase X-2 [Fusarium oligoseptatum]